MRRSGSLEQIQNDLIGTRAYASGRGEDGKNEICTDREAERAKCEGRKDIRGVILNCGDAIQNNEVQHCVLIAI